MSLQAQKAERFRALHRGRRILLLPNAWDVASARAFEDAGFPAVATSSAGLMASLGYRDGEEIPRGELVAAVGRIAERLSVPLSADVVAGFGRTPQQVAATARMVLRAGAVGLNLEDLDPTNGGLFPEDAQVRKILAIRRVGESMGIPIVINARTDALRHGTGDDAERMREATRRSVAYRDAGADCVYPMGLTAASSIAAFVAALRFPVNVMVRKGLPSVARLERLGVRRLSFGPSASYATMGLLGRIGREVLGRGTYRSLVEGAIGYEELQRLGIPRAAPSSRS
jgi:2-methylisocitrate lyase-like PEP mutase family enzyme